jgi:hypothetical protein
VAPCCRAARPGGLTRRPGGAVAASLGLPYIGALAAAGGAGSASTQPAVLVLSEPGAGVVVLGWHCNSIGSQCAVLHFMQVLHCKVFRGVAICGARRMCTVLHELLCSLAALSVLSPLPCPL